MSASTGGLVSSGSERLPRLDLYVDLPNVERELKRLNLPHKLDWGRIGKSVAARVAGAPYHLQRVNCFASTTRYDPRTGKGRPEGWYNKLVELPSVQVRWGHRLRFPDVRGAASADHGVEKLGREKGVDVALASTMVERACTSRFDVALLISNDTDFATVAWQMRRLGKRVLWGHLETQRDNRYLPYACERACLLSVPFFREHELKTSQDREARSRSE
ncbi:NYN domain-containing protein [Longimicrobium sp.]|uniref:NYN domain-containing protein n=1 Tax=Longimicrobium sp. TaxID=2029185 RepID=UPI003B3A6448